MATVFLSCVLLGVTILQLVSGQNDMKCPKQKVQNCDCAEYSPLVGGTFMNCSQISDPKNLRSALEILRDNPIYALKLDSISLPYLPREGLFKGTSMRLLWLSNSDLQYIAPLGVKGPSPFEGLEDSVTKIKIEGMHKLVSMDWSEFSSLKKLYRIEMSSLTLKVIDQSLSKLQPSFGVFQLMMGDVKRISPGAFDINGIESINVQLNTIDRLDRNIFGKNPNLVDIALSQNKFKELSEDFFDNLPALKYVNIEYNHLTRLPSSLRTNWAQFRDIRIAGNWLSCDCDLVWLLKAAKTSPPKRSDLEDVTCGSPSRLARMKLLTLNETDLCP